jgi:hydroxyethylthiazole kinase
MHHPQTASRDSVAQAAFDIISRLRGRSPRVHCITNTVAQNFTANSLLAVRCDPSMTLSREEIGPFVAGAQSLLVNLGTFDSERRLAIGVAVETAARLKLPWVLDPVFVDRAPPRAIFARELIGRRPPVIRLNHAEFSRLAGDTPSRDAAMKFARANRPLRETVARIGLAEHLRHDWLFPSVHAAVEAFRSRESATASVPRRES